MRLGKILVQNGSGFETVSFEKFRSSGLVMSILGELLLDLLAETAWSPGYWINASFGRNPELQITHPCWKPDEIAFIKPGDAATVDEVREMVASYLRNAEKMYEEAAAANTRREGLMRKLQQEIAAATAEVGTPT